MVGKWRMLTRCIASYLFVTFGHSIAVVDVDVVVYGGTPAGIAAATKSAARGRMVELVLPGMHVGGMTSGGIGWDDIFGVKPDDLTPVYGRTSSYTQFTSRIESHYRDISARAWELCVNGTRHEPHVAEKIFMQMLAEAGVHVLYGCQLIKVSTIDNRVPREREDLSSTNTNTNMTNTQEVSYEETELEGRGRRTITSICIQFQNSTEVELRAKHYIDATYMGDMMAAAGVEYVVGRESRSTFVLLCFRCVPGTRVFVIYPSRPR